MFQNIHDSYDELKSSTLMSPKLLAMCGIVKRSHGEFDSNILITHPLNNAPTPSLQLYTVLRIKAIYLRSLGLVTAVNSKDNIFKWCVEQGQRCYNQTLLFVQIHLFKKNQKYDMMNI